MNNQSVNPKILLYQLGDSKALQEYLEYSGFKVIAASSDTVMEKAKFMDYDLCIMDHYNGLELLNAIRTASDKMPIIFLSHKDTSGDIVKALDNGADDYVIIPYNMPVLVARIRALLRRSGPRLYIQIADSYKIGDFDFDVKAETITYKTGAPEKIGPNKAKMLALMCAYAGEPVPFSILLTRIWGEESPRTERLANVCACHMRKDFARDSRIQFKVIGGKTLNKGYALVIDNGQITI